MGSVNVAAGKVRGWLTAPNATPALLKGNLNSTSRCRQAWTSQDLATQRKAGPCSKRAGAQAWASWLPIAISKVHPPHLAHSSKPLDAGGRRLALRRAICRRLHSLHNLFHLQSSALGIVSQVDRSSLKPDPPGPGFSQSHWHRYALPHVTIKLPCTWDYTRRDPREPITWTDWPPVWPKTRVVTRWRSLVVEAMFGRGKGRPCRLLNAQPSPTPLIQVRLCCRAAYALLLYSLGGRRERITGIGIKSRAAQVGCGPGVDSRLAPAPT